PAVVDEFAVAAVAYASLARPVPQVPLRRSRDLEIAFAGIGIFAMLVVPVTHRPGFLDKIGRVRAHGPLVAVGADFILDVKIIQQDEVARELVVVGSDARANRQSPASPLPSGTSPKTWS